MNQEIMKYIWYILPVLCGGFSFYLWKTGKKEKLKKIIALLVLEIGKNFMELSGKEKFDMVLDNILGSMPPILRVLISKEWIKKTIQKEYERLKLYIEKNILNPIDMAGKAVDLLVDKAISTSYNMDNNLVSNDQLKDIKTEVKNDVIYGNLKLKSDLKRKSSLVAELGFNKSI